MCRVSVPHSILQPTSQFKPHRRRSFDPVDSMGLAKVHLLCVCVGGGGRRGGENLIRM